MMKPANILNTLLLTALLSCTSNTTNQVTTKKFREKGNTAVFTTSFVIKDHKDITYVTHDKGDGAWQFLSNDHFENFADVAKIVGLAQIVKMDSTLLEIADLPEGYTARRQFKGDKWIIEKHE